MKKNVHMKFLYTNMKFSWFSAYIPGYEVPKMDLHVHMNIYVHISSYGNLLRFLHITSYVFFIFFLHIVFIYFLHIFSSYALHMSTSYLYEHYVQHLLQ